MRLVFATCNAGKVAELQALLAGHPLEVVSFADLGQVDDVAETGATFEENAALKARAAHARSGLPALADDSGLLVDALGGAPGVRSARYAGEPRSDTRNLAKLLDDLKDVPSARRGARFHCALCLCTDAGRGQEPRLTLRSGTVEGTILPAARGTGGFGYDPLFVPLERELRAAGLDVKKLRGRTFAEMNIAEKNRLSHRARALQGMLPEVLLLAV